MPPSWRVISLTLATAYQPVGCAEPDFWHPTTVAEDHCFRSTELVRSLMPAINRGMLRSRFCIDAKTCSLFRIERTSALITMATVLGLRIDSRAVEASLLLVRIATLISKP